MLVPAVSLLAVALSQDLTPATATDAFDLALELSEEAGGEPWGRSLFGPMLLVDPRAGRMIANEPDAQDVLVEEGGVFAAQLPPEVLVANTAQDWNGVHWTTLVWPLPADVHARRRLLAHELFHRLQRALRHSQVSAPNTHLDTLEARIDLRLEMRALAAALTATGDERRAATRDALQFRARRRAGIPDAARAEDALEQNEGLAEYTGWRHAGHTDAELPGLVAARLLRDETADTFQRSFAYATGPAWAVLIDEAGEEPGAWCRTYRPGTSLSVLVAKAYALEELDSGVDLDARAGVYGGREVVSDELRREEKRQARIDVWRARFIEGPTLRLPDAGGGGHTFNPNRVGTFPGQGQVFETLTANDLWGRLDVTSGGALVPSAGPQAYIVGAPQDLGVRELRGDGWTLELAAGWTVVPGERDGDWVVARE